MKNLRKALTILLTAGLMVALLPVTSYAQPVESSSDSSTEFYQYRITVESPEWNALESVADKIEACRIPDDELANMSDVELIQAIMDFPLRIEIFAYDDPAIGVKALENISDAYEELLSRESAEASLLEYVRQRSNARLSGISAEEEIKNDILVMLILYQDEFQNKLSTDEIQEVADISASINVKSSSLISSSATDGPKTPNGTSVNYITKTCNHSSSNYHAAADQEYVKAYGVTLISPGSCKYNCHSYAWYSQSTNNKYWIDNPSVYMTDGSYKKVMSGINSSSIDVVSGNKLIYGSSSAPTHSAIVTSSATGAPLATRTVKSKWGSLGVFSHGVTNVPSAYDTSNVSAWRRK